MGRILLLVPVIVLFLVEGFFIVRFMTLARRFDVYFKRAHPEKAKEWLGRGPTLDGKRLIGGFWAMSCRERGDMPDDATLRDLQRKATHAHNGILLSMLVFFLLVTLCAVLIEFRLSI